jgi:AcrR family transcriptional regulator
MSAIDLRPLAAAPIAAAERLMDAAERLIATRQGAGVSDRAIIHEAGQHNNSAITYHFGSRSGLLDAVWHRRLQRVSSRRDELLAEFQQPIYRLDLPSAVTLYIQPLCSEIGSLDPSHWARFNERLLNDLPLDFVAWVRNEMANYRGTSASDQLLALFGRLQELLVGVGISPLTAQTRVALAAKFVITSLAGWERSVAIGKADADGLPALQDDLISMTVAMLEAKTDGRS